ncbi:MAG: 2-methylisocitrate lyase [SAR86 cluster bacterium]|uniref:2-methylisocitrate lyase n=1 Tax=SAR86 cluster bacterium TaxID=2030880 RepID=A0A2A4X6N0_9GAMM|nr:MAG: 2-methylisocitrate lyase [SAR86 cluster bacterium]
MTTQIQKCEAFARLHQSETAWIIPNPWDVGSAKLLQGRGFQALATTSSGFAYTLGRADGEVSLDEKLQHCRLLSAATDIPINADFENGYSEHLSDVIENIKRLAETGIAGFSIEDFSREHHQLYEFSEAVERVQAAVETVADLGAPLVLTARAENLLRGADDLDDTIKRLQAFEAVGADVLYAPGIKSLAQLRTVTASLEKPFNVLASFMPGTNVAELGECGANRISLGGALNFAAINPVLDASVEMIEKGTFDWLGGRADGAAVTELLKGSD